MMIMIVSQRIEEEAQKREDISSATTATIALSFPLYTYLYKYLTEDILLHIYTLI